MIAAALRHSAKALHLGDPRIPIIGRNPQKCLPRLSLTRSIVSAPPARRVSLAYKLGFFVFFFLWLMVPEMAMVVAIPDHAGTSIKAIKAKAEKEAMEAARLEEE